MSKATNLTSLSRRECDFDRYFVLSTQYKVLAHPSP